MQRQKNYNSELSYLGNSNIKRDGIEHSFTKHEIDEFVKCSRDPVYFAKNYMKVINIDEGLVPFHPYPYQQNMLQHLQDNRFSIVLACRQSGKSITSIAFLLWTALFQAEQTIAILANKGAISKEMLSRITLALENIPFFLQPGCRALNKMSVEFSNHSKIIAAATSSSSIRGLSVSTLFLDEFAFVDNAAEFYTSTYPVISSGKNSKVVITSTANGIGNMYYQLWEGAVQGTNEYAPFRVDWWDVPGRDENWKKQTIANTSEIQFKQEFGNSFIGTSNTLIESDTLLSLQAEQPIKTMHENSLRVYEEPIDGHFYIMAVDVSQGRGQDCSAFNIIDITAKPFRQVASYHNNKISPLLLPNIIVKIAKHYHNALLLIENNGPGQIVCNSVYYDFEYENTFVESAIKAGGIGITTTKRIKNVGTSNLKDLVEMKRLMIRDGASINELSCFEASGSSYKAVNGQHDDLVMTLVLFSWFVSTEAFGEYDETQLRDMIYHSRAQELEDEMLDFGFISSESDSMGDVLNPAYDEIRDSLEQWSNFGG